MVGQNDQNFVLGPVATFVASICKIKYEEKIQKLFY